jgi:hypothetical protein
LVDLDSQVIDPNKIWALGVVADFLRDYQDLFPFNRVLAEDDTYDPLFFHVVSFLFSSSKAEGNRFEIDARFCS